jgi:hypothetical protein
MPTKCIEKEQMSNILYALAVDNLMYAQVCTRPDLTFTVGILRRFQSNSEMNRWKTCK